MYNTGDRIIYRGHHCTVKGRGFGRYTLVFDEPVSLRIYPNGSSLYEKTWWCGEEVVHQQSTFAGLTPKKYIKKHSMTT